MGYFDFRLMKLKDTHVAVNTYVGMANMHGISLVFGYGLAQKKRKTRIYT